MNDLNAKNAFSSQPDARDVTPNSPPPVQRAYRKEYVGGPQVVPPRQPAYGPARPQTPGQGYAGRPYGEAYSSRPASAFAAAPQAQTPGQAGTPTGTPPKAAGGAQREKRERRRRKSGAPVSRATFILVLVLALILAPAAGFGGAYLYDQIRPSSLSESAEDGGNARQTAPAHADAGDKGGEAASPKGDARQDEASPASNGPSAALTTPEIVKKTSPAVVAINCKVQTQDSFGFNQTGVAAGSGVLISSKGYLVTNNHVIAGAGAGDIMVTTADGEQYKAELVGTNPNQDLAVLKIEGKDFPYVEFGQSSDLEVGERVIAIGNPLGELQGTVTQGVISALHRSLNIEGSVMNDLIQTDVAINHGNSGGALLNDRGELIGINVARSEGGMNGGVVQGIAFAIPSNTVKRIVTQLMDPNYRPSFIGIRGDSVSEEMSAQYGISRGIWIASVIEGSPAEKAGLKVRDIITAIDGEAVASITEIQAYLGQKKVGDTVKLSVDRSSDMIEIDVVLGEQPKDLRTRN